MTSPRAVLVAGLFFSSVISAGHSQSAPALRDTTGLAWANRLLTAMHAQEALLTSIDSAFAGQRKAAGTQGLPPLFFDSLSVRIHRIAPQLIDSLAAIYATQLSVPDLKELVRFYESPIGQRYASAQTAFEFQSMAMAKRWGARVALDVMRELIDKGLISDIH